MNLRYKGFLDTPSLFLASPITGVEVLDIDFDTKFLESSFDLPKSGRLGHLAESFLVKAVSLKYECDRMLTNLQIVKDGLTMGELDLIIESKSMLLHIENAYKFYLYVEGNDSCEITKWIGPNRNDSLIEKINKLKDHQFPLIFKEESSKYITDYGFDLANISQQLCFKAQLFIPFKKNDITFNRLNGDCVTGVYMSINELNELKDVKLKVIPKLDWFITPYALVDWPNYERELNQIQKDLDLNKSPLIWIKLKNGVILKSFIIWW